VKAHMGYSTDLTRGGVAGKGPAKGVQKLAWLVLFGWSDRSRADCTWQGHLVRVNFFSPGRTTDKTKPMLLGRHVVLNLKKKSA
jgi:hypothetical protein